LRLFYKLFLSYLLVVFFAEAAVVLLVDLLAPRFFQGHVARMVHMVTMMGGGPMAELLKADLEQSLKSTLNLAFHTSLPLAFALAAAVAYFVSRRLTRTAEMLAEASRRVAAGDFRVRLPVSGGDELAELAAHFNRLAEALERIEETRAELIGNVAHELRTPLAALQGYAEAMADHVLTPAEGAARITREVEAMARLVEDLARVSRVEVGSLSLQLGVYAVPELLDRAVERFKEAFREKGITLRLEASPVLRPVRADRDRVLQVLSNLLANALKFTPEGGRVRVVAREGEGEVQICVEDSGPGVPPELRDRVFERFFRGDPARRRSGGSGVGLTIAKGLVEAMGGRIWVEDADLGGARFCFTLPVYTPLTKPA